MTPDLPARPSAETRTPGIASAAAVLGFVEAWFGLAFVAYALVMIASFGADGADKGVAALVLLPTTVLCGLTVLGSLFLVRRTGRRLLVVASIVEIVLVVGIGLWALGDIRSYSAPGDPFAYASGPGAAVNIAFIVLLLVGLGAPVVRLALALQPSVGTWLRTRPSSAPVWSAETQQWTAASRSGTGTVVAVLAPVVLVFFAVVVVLLTTDDSLDYSIADGPAVGGSSQWDDLYDGGTPVAPPDESNALYQAQYDDDAQNCYDGDLVACDDLYFDAEYGSLYEWLGSTCGGREEYETYGFCS